MADYTYHELMKMQNDAIRRVEDMQKKARQSAGLNNTEKEKKEIPVEEPKRIPMPPNYLNNLKERNNQSNKGEKNPFENIKNIFGDINISSDTALLLSLILLLTEEKADETLIMALLYMLT